MCSVGSAQKRVSTQRHVRFRKLTPLVEHQAYREIDHTSALTAHSRF